MNLNRLFTNIINDTCNIITGYLSKCVKDNTKVITQVTTKEGTNTELINITFDNPILSYTFAFPVMQYVQLANDTDIPYALRAVCSKALTKYSDLMFDYFLQDPNEVEKVIKNIK